MKQKILLLIIILILAAGIYLNFSGPTLPDPVSAPRSGSGTATLISEETQQQARDHIERLTAGAQQAPIEISRADNFVTGEQLIQIPAMAAEKIAITSDADNHAAQAQAVDALPGFQPSLIDRTELKQQTRNLSDRIALTPGQQIRLQELLSEPQLAAGSIFYIHAVTDADQQGLWGILQHGLIDTFAKGIDLRQSGRRLSASIPELADERLANQRSSFLGNFLYQKVNDTFVFNYAQGMLGQDPNMIKPGQQLIIVSYSEAELISIYNHFTQRTDTP